MATVSFSHDTVIKPIEYTSKKNLDSVTSLNVTLLQRLQSNGNQAVEMFCVLFIAL